jgi:class 3 adenylate cyclase
LSRAGACSRLALVMVCAACGHENGPAARFCESCGAALSGGSEERRKVVTVLFCDVVGSTSLGESTDPEALRALLARYFEVMRGIVESHEGTVEKFIGDAVMAVFGVPVVHEDDALRACRAAVEMRDAFAGLGIEGRIGVCTGEVVTGTVERLATGDALNVAARLQGAAAPGEVLIAKETRLQAGLAIEVEAVEPLGLKGKSEPVPAFRLVAAREAAERPHDSVFVGRARELELLAGAWARAVEERRCELVTVVGDPGIGKSRLAAEALATMDARVVRGRCLPYGAGVTYWPVVEVIKQLDALPSDPAASRAIRSLLGESDEGASAEEIAWAFRKLLEEQAPLVVVFDDMQWGEETFLDLIEHLTLLSAGAPLLLLCMARPELLDRRPAWPVTARLEPLTGKDTATLIGAGLPEELRARIEAAAATRCSSMRWSRLPPRTGERARSRCLPR